ncbi:MAG: hypothetical protein IJ184_01945 [Alphaproteobacteria bacterium]|nr:hypothetical protein [Alphaproteobacteria bacterium]
MTEKKTATAQPRAKQRIAREAANLRKNLAKRKLQQSLREQQKKDKTDGQD